jgi:hypothetical protein
MQYKCVNDQLAILPPRGTMSESSAVYASSYAEWARLFEPSVNLVAHARAPLAPHPLPETSHREILAVTEAAGALSDAAITSCRWKRPVSASRADSVKRWAASFPEEGRTAIVSRNTL